MVARFPSLRILSAVGSILYVKHVACYLSTYVSVPRQQHRLHCRGQTKIKEQEAWSITRYDMFEKPGGQQLLIRELPVQSPI